LVRTLAFICYVSHAIYEIQLSTIDSDNSHRVA